MVNKDEYTSWNYQQHKNGFEVRRNESWVAEGGEEGRYDGEVVSNSLLGIRLEGEFLEFLL